MTNTAFPIQWEHPDDAKRHWSWDKDHQTRPRPWLINTISTDVVSVGSRRAAERLSSPRRTLSLILNGYIFYATEWAPADVKAQMEAQQQKLLDELTPDLARRWREEFEPELQRDFVVWRALDLSALSWEALAQHLTHVLERVQRHWEIHFLVVFPVLHSTKPLARLYAQWAGDTDELAPYRLIAGQPTKTSERDFALWELSEAARATPAVAEAFAHSDLSHVLPTLRALPEAQSFLRAFEAHIAEYGDRSEGELETPTWRENPQFLVNALQALLSAPRRDLPAAQAETLAEREQLVAETLAKIPADQQATFKQALALARDGYPLRETHAFYIDQMSMAFVRYVVIEIGRRLVARGFIAQAEDVFHFKIQELQSLLQQPIVADWPARMAARRAEFAQWMQMQPPDWIGAPPPAPANGTVQPSEPSTPTPQTTLSLKGVAGSRGVARGPARVIHTHAEVGKVQAGDVLVCTTTFPPWTALFHSIVALVTDVGGVLSHGAIVAREYKLPAVLGTQRATQLIHDGQMVEVDGTQGVVTILTS